MYYQKTTAELLAQAIKVCNKICDCVKTYHSRGDCVSDIAGLARSCKEVLEVFQSVLEHHTKDDPVFASIEKIITKSEDDIRELKKRLKEIKYSNQKWPGLNLFSMFRGKDLPHLKSNLQSLRDNLGSAKKVTTITVEKCEQRTVQTILRDETDEEIESPPPRYTRYEKQPSSMYCMTSTSTDTLHPDFMASNSRYPTPAYRSLHKTTNGANFRLREADLPDDENNTMTCPRNMGCWPPSYEERYPTRPTGVCIAMNYRLRAAPRAPLCVVIPRGVQVGLYLGTC